MVVTLVEQLVSNLSRFCGDEILGFLMGLKLAAIYYLTGYII